MRKTSLSEKIKERLFPKPKTFRDLMESKKVSTKELKATMKDYVETGGGIVARVVIEIIDRVKLSALDLAELYRMAKAGQKNQERRGQPDAKEYEKVAEHLKELMRKRTGIWTENL